MKLYELADKDLEMGRYDPSEDKLNTRNLSDTRKPTLTLRQLNRLKKIRALKKMENLKQEDLLSIMYGMPEDGGGGAGGPF